MLANFKDKQVMKHIPTTKKHIVLRERYKEITFCVMYESVNGGIVEKFNQGSQSKTEKYKNIEALKILANNGKQYRLLPVIQDGKKNPDAFNLLTLKYADIKVAESTNGKNAIQSALKEANKQEVSEVIIHFTQKLNLKCKTTKNNIISSYKEDYFFDRKIREDRVLDDLDRFFQN